MGVPLGGIIPIQLQLSLGETNLFPLAHVFDATYTELVGSPVALTHVANGLYMNTTLTMPLTGFVVAQYIVYSDSGHTTPVSHYQFSEDEFEFLPAGNIVPQSNNLTEIVGYVVQSVGPINHSPIPDQQALNIVQGEDLIIQVRLKNMANFQPYYTANVASITAQFLNADQTILSISGTIQANDASVAQFVLSSAQTANLMLGNAQSFQVALIQVVSAQNVKTLIPMNGSLNVLAQV